MHVPRPLCTLHLRHGRNKLACSVKGMCTPSPFLPNPHCLPEKGCLAWLGCSLYSQCNDDLAPGCCECKCCDPADGVCIGAGPTFHEVGVFNAALASAALPVTESALAGTVLHSTALELIAAKGTLCLEGSTIFFGRRGGGGR